MFTRILEINMRAFFFRRHLSSAALECSLLGVKRSGPVTAAAPVEAMSCRINVYWLPSQRTTPLIFVALPLLDF